MKRINTYMRKAWSDRRVRYALGALVLAVAGWYFFLRGGSTNTQTLVMAPADFTQTVAVSGTVIAAQDVDLGFSQGGRIARVSVAVGEQVGQGQVLAEVENADLAANVDQQQALLAQQQAKLSSLEAGAQPADIAASQAALAKAQQDLANYYQSIADTAQSAYTSANDAVRTQLSSLFTNAEGSNPQVAFSTSNSQAAIDAGNARAAASTALNTWQSELAALPATPTQAELTKVLSDSLTYLGSMRSLLSSVSAALDGSTISASALATDKGYVVVGQTEINAAVKSLNTISQNIASQTSSVSQAQAELDLKKAGATTQDIAAQQALVAQAQASVEAAQAQLRKTIITAPFAGTITRVDAKVGLAAAANTPQISLESAGTFQIEAYVPEVSVAQVAVGNKATVTLDAYGQSVPFDASVVSIDPAQTMRDGVSTYRVVLQFSGPDQRIRSGMTATISIVTAEHPHALAVPGGAVFTKNGVQMVQVVRDGSAVDVPVMTGGTTVGNVEVTSGLSAGDVVLLTPDTSR